VLAVDEKSLLVTPLRDRKALLGDILQDTEQFIKTSYITTTDPKQLQNFHEEKLAEGLEGVVIKQVDSPYQSGRKGWYWVKMKHAEGEKAKLKDTLDCIVMGYYVGRGKRTSFGIGAFLVGILNDEKAIVTIAKIGTGISDEQLRDLKERCDSLKVATQPPLYSVAKELHPDVWIQPQLVTEIAADEVTRSPNHTAGIALRFPRLIKIRDDKSWEDATTAADVKQIVG
jgi:DNA ligase-1